MIFSAEHKGYLIYIYITEIYSYRAAFRIRLERGGEDPTLKTYTNVMLASLIIISKVFFPRETAYQ